MSFGASGTNWASLLTSSSSTSSDSATSTTSLRHYAHLAESQRTQLRALLNSSQSSGLTTDQLEQQIQAIIDGTSTTSSSGSQTGSSSSSSTSSDTDSSSSGTSTTASSNPFANLDLTAAQKTQIQTILQDAQSQGTSPSDVLSQIENVLTTTQQSTLQTDLQQLQALGAPPPPPPGPPPSGADGLTDDQKSQIESILQDAQSAGTDVSTLSSQIEAVLDGTSSSTASTVQNAQSTNSGLQSSGGESSSTSWSATLANGLSASDVQRQAAAALSILEHSLADQYSSG
jgi:hypothetical protein